MKGFSMTMGELLTRENLKVFDMVDVLENFTEHRQFWPQTRNHSEVVNRGRTPIAILLEE